MLRTHVRPLVVGLAFATAATAGYAQQLEEVVVTAQKREQSLSDVPISVTAVSGELVQDAAIKSFRELGAYVPNLSITENAVNSIISMRGIGVGAQQSFEQSVGVFVDGVHLGKSRQTRLGLFDLEQVEVLRGPQGILFGKNTLAGAVNVRTASPELGGETEGRFAASKESYNGSIYEGWFQTSLSEDLAVRFAMRETNTDGYLDNSFASEANGATPTGPTTDERIWRASVKWEPTDATTVDIKYLESKFKRIGSTATITITGRMSASLGNGTRGRQPDRARVSRVPSRGSCLQQVLSVERDGFFGGATPVSAGRTPQGGGRKPGNRPRIAARQDDAHSPKRAPNDRKIRKRIGKTGCVGFRSRQRDGSKTKAVYRQGHRRSLRIEATSFSRPRAFTGSWGVGRVFAGHTA
jgi:outer membrane receptor protein involved in Fe transport